MECELFIIKLTSGQVMLKDGALTDQTLSVPQMEPCLTTP